MSPQESRHRVNSLTQCGPEGGSQCLGRVFPSTSGLTLRVKMRELTGFVRFCVLLLCPAGAMAVDVGERAPEFTLPAIATNAQPIKLSDYQKVAARYLLRRGRR